MILLFKFLALALRSQYLPNLKHRDLSVTAGMEISLSLQAWSHEYGYCRHGAMAMITAGIEISLSPQTWSHKYGYCRHGAMAMATAGMEPWIWLL